MIPELTRSRPKKEWLARRPLLRLDGAGRVWALSAVIAIVAAVTFAAAVRDLSPVPAPLRIPWWGLAFLFYLTEVMVVHFQFRREVHTFSMSEIPLVLGLFLATPTDFVIANVLGAAAGLILHRKQSAVKLAFNVSQFALGAVLAVSIFYFLRTPGGSLAPGDWMAAFLAALAANIVGIVAIAAAIALSERRIQLEKLGHVFRFGIAVGLTNTSLALIAVTILWNEPRALWLLTVPVVLLFLAYRAYMSERERHESLEFLYESTRILHRTPELDGAIVALLDHARRMFKAEVAEVTLFPSGEGKGALRTSLGADTPAEIMAPVDTALMGDIWARSLEEGRGFLIRRAGNSGVINSGTSRFEIRDAIVTPLRGDRGVLGMMLVGNRLGDVSTFDDEDLKLLETLASHAGIALENGRLGESLTQLAELKEQLRYQAYHDPLTGLGNRSLFLERVGEALERRDDSEQVPAVLFVDLDDFKTVNDSMGHASGDALLIAVSERLRSCIRPTDLAVRLGGDEFAILLQDSLELHHALAIGERLIETLQPPFMLHGQEVSIKASVGIAGCRSRSDGPEELLRNADVAMYTAKSEGKGRVAVFEPAMHAAVVARHALTAELQRAVAREEFVVHYQPIVALRSGRVTGVEALVRWKRPNGSLIVPGEFISVAEETGLILPLGRWVLEEACRQAREWQRQQPDRPLLLSVNLSPRQVQQRGFIDEVAEILDKTKLDPTRLMLEVTETVMMQDTPTTLTKLQALKQLGVRLAIDDFGTGYSSLSYLRRFPVDVLKMAKPFVDNAGRDRGDSAFATAIVALGHSLGLEVTAEGIERADQLEFLRDLGVDAGQGFFFARPLDDDALTAALRRTDPPPSIRAAVAGRERVDVGARSAVLTESVAESRREVVPAGAGQALVRVH